MPASRALILRRGKIRKNAQVLGLDYYFGVISRMTDSVNRLALREMRECALGMGMDAELVGAADD